LTRRSEKQQLDLKNIHDFVGAIKIEIRSFAKHGLKIITCMETNSFLSFARFQVAPAFIK
jgi:hypothetical protein